MNHVIGRLFWDGEHPSPWVSFRNVTEYRDWARDIRRALPRTKTQYAYVDWVHNSRTLLDAARSRAIEGAEPTAVPQQDYSREGGTDADEA